MHQRKYFTLNFFINEIFSVEKFPNYGTLIGRVHVLSRVRRLTETCGKNLRKLYCQGGDTAIYSVLRSSSSVKMKVKGQPPKIADSQKSNCLLAGQESTSSFM